VFIEFFRELGRPRYLVEHPNPTLGTNDTTPPYSPSIRRHGIDLLSLQSRQPLLGLSHEELNGRDVRPLKSRVSVKLLTDVDFECRPGFPGFVPHGEQEGAVERQNLELKSRVFDSEHFLEGKVEGKVESVGKFSFLEMIVIIF